jgi:hypothetical protein
MTIFRVHPVDGVLAANCGAVFVGLTAGCLTYLFGSPVGSFTVNGTNAVLVLFYFFTVHLQHTHMWIAATGPLGCVLSSPRITRSITLTIRRTSIKTMASVSRYGTGCSGRFRFRHQSASG